MNKLKSIDKCFNKFPSFLRKNYNFYIFNSYMLGDINYFMKTNYNVENFLDNDVETLISRNCFVHNCYTFNE